MKQSCSVFSVSSLDDLRQQLAGSAQRRGTQYAVLSISDPAVVVCSFVFEAPTSRKLQECVEKESSSLLSLPVQDVVCDHHVFYSSDNKAHGILACVPKRIFDAYVQLLNQHKVTVVCAMPAIVAAANTFFQTHQNMAGRFCLLNVTPSKAVQCVIFFDGHCELLREIRFEGADVMQRDVVQTLKSVYAGSAAKKFDQIFIGGHADPEIPLARWMEESFQIRPQTLASLNVVEALCRHRHELNVNLSRKYSLPLRWRGRLLRFLDSVILVLFAAVCFLGFNIYNQQRQTQELKSSFDAAAYADAVELERMLR